MNIYYISEKRIQTVRVVLTSIHRICNLNFILIFNLI
nr:MAG TPA: hypothetical protein [Caudoviricetes sp.]